jgi:hypothetical protein
MYRYNSRYAVHTYLPEETGSWMTSICSAPSHAMATLVVLFIEYNVI